MTVTVTEPTQYIPGPTQTVILQPQPQPYFPTAVPSPDDDDDDPLTPEPPRPDGVLEVPNPRFEMWCDDQDLDIGEKYGIPDGERIPYNDVFCKLYCRKKRELNVQVVQDQYDSAVSSIQRPGLLVWCDGWDNEEYAEVPDSELDNLQLAQPVQDPNDPYGPAYYNRAKSGTNIT